jgi:hypothetical protein
MVRSWTLSVRVNTPGTAGYRLQVKILDMIGSLKQQMAGELYTPYQEMARPFQVEEEGPPT